MKTKLVFLLFFFNCFTASAQIETKLSNAGIKQIEYNLLNRIGDRILMFQVAPEKYLEINEIDFLNELQFSSPWVNGRSFLEKVKRAYGEKFHQMEKKKRGVLKRIIKKIKEHSSLHPDYVVFLKQHIFKGNAQLLGIIEEGDWNSAALKELEGQVLEKIRTTKELLNQNVKSSHDVEFLNNGYIEYGTQILRGTVRLIKLRVGEPKVLGIRRFNLPLSVFVSAKDSNSAAAGGSSGTEMMTEEKGRDAGDERKESFLELIDPMGGTINFSTYQTFRIARSKFDMTHLNAFVHLGGKAISGEADAAGLTTLPRVNGYASAGFFFDTGAWQDGEFSNIGRFYLQSSLGLQLLGRRRSREVFNNELNAALFHWSSEIGLYVKESINVKLCLFKSLSHTKNAEFAFLNRFYVKAGIAYSFDQQ